MKLGVIADDFTGATDIALTLAEGGMSVTQFVGVPVDKADADIEAGVVALKSRTAPKQEAVADSLAACDWLLAQGASQIVLKVCSTFDSTAEGNIGPVLEALAARLGETHVLVCPAFPENGRSVYQGHLFVKDKLLSESGMQNHPLTPMTNSDIRQVLASQTDWHVGHIQISKLRGGADAVRDAMRTDRSMIIVDAIEDADLWSIGMAAQHSKLLCGGSGIALGLPKNFGVQSSETRWDPVVGRGVIISGSCSEMTRQQVDTYKENHPALEIKADQAVQGILSADQIAKWVFKQESCPLIYSSADPTIVRQAQEKFGAKVVAEAIENLFAQLAKVLADKGVVRIVVAGGETSGAVTSALSASALQIGPRIAAGVPVVRLKGRPFALALKSGNFGQEDFFERALNVMETAE